MKHLGMKDLLSLARKGEQSTHLDACSFCREQYQLAVEFLAFSPDTVRREEDSIQQAEGPSAFRQSQYRLAAQTTQSVTPMFRLRRTWYFDNNSMILRVIEDLQRGILTGFFITERNREELRIKFDGLDEVFQPDRNGVFEIGSATINIEPMKVILVKE
ncbi:MAG: hypothetical protein RRA94_09485 [Bacteroidota bacterium]|nr:hypothetical protein [Bacteroidota bacterium]